MKGKITIFLQFAAIIGAIMAMVLISAPASAVTCSNCNFNLGGTQFNPILPNASLGISWSFTGSQAPTTIQWFDPILTSGFDFNIVSGPNFQSVTVPVGIDTVNQQFTIAYGSLMATLFEGGSLDFGSGGVSSFAILDIEPGVDASSNSEFPVGLSFVSAAPFAFTMTPTNVPEPATFTLLVLGLFGIFGRHCRFDAFKSQRLLSLKLT